MTARNATITSSGIDYIRVTGKAGEPRQSLANIYNEWANLLCSEGHTEKPFGGYGYRGYMTGNITYGNREEDAMLQVSGSLAGHVITRLPAEGIKCSRIDLQNTFVFGSDYEAFYLDTANAIRAFQAANPARSYPAVGVVGYYGQGFTCNVGKRTSAAYGRVYDKGREALGVQDLGTWRHEVEFKNELATKILQTEALRQDQAATSAGMVADWFATRGAIMPYCVPKQVSAPTVKHEETDSEKQIRWLKTTVAPTVAKLFEAGLGPEALAAILSVWTATKPDVDKDDIV